MPNRTIEACLSLVTHIIMVLFEMSRLFNILLDLFIIIMTR